MLIEILCCIFQDVSPNLDTLLDKLLLCRMAIPKLEKKVYHHIVEKTGIIALHLIQLYLCQFVNQNIVTTRCTTHV